ncbi:MAG: hypothetical protein O9289_07540 [Rhodobacteraceae bacterium]|nr:hypothetical protein [Paracoccaceae bacterium]MCZ8083045.1 hypothetical protein [Paracoccaceae bacterium]
MIIKQTRIPAGSGQNVVDHVLHGEDNEECAVLLGDVHEVEALAEARASTYRRKYCVRHAVLSPDQLLTRRQTAQLIQTFLDEFDAGDREYAVIIHLKMRTDGSKIPHLHLLVCECDRRGRVLNWQMTMKKNEKLARVAEVELGHSLTLGRHNRAVAHHLVKHGHNAASIIEPLARLPRPRAQYTSSQYQSAKRAGIPLKEIALRLKEAVEDHEMTKIDLLRSLADEHQLTFTKGADDQTILIMAQGKRKIASVNRLLRMNFDDPDTVLQQLMQQTEPTALTAI